MCVVLNGMGIHVINEAYKGCLRITHDDFVKSISNISPSIEILSQYKNRNKKIDVRCKVCGYQWKTTPNLLLKGSGCVSCAGLKRKTTDEFVSIMKTISPHLEILGDYKNTKTKIKVKSNVCNHVWESSPNSLLKGKGCPFCAGNLRKTTEQFIDEM